MYEAISKLRARMDPIPEGRYLIGLSGGADSVALTLALLPEIREGRIRAEAVHVNHGLRGDEADGDEAFARNLCIREGIPFHPFRADLGGKTDEAAAREARYACFRACLEQTGARAVLLAHHADDQAETFLMRLLRGAGPEGLAGMSPQGTVFGVRCLRPMLSLRREEIRKALREDGVCWREDSSNDDTAYLRNRIRNGLIPEMEAIVPGAAGRISRAAALTEKDNRFLNEEAAKLLERVADGRRIDAEALKEAPEALKARTLRMWWNRCAPERKEHALNAGQTAVLTALADGKRGSMNLPGGLHAVRGKRFLHLTGTGEAPEMPVPFEGPEVRFGEFLLTEEPSEGNPGDGKRHQEVPRGFTSGCVIRTRIPGDRIRPFGSTGSRKLQDYLTDRKVDEPFRDRIPLLCRGNEVLLVCGVGAGNVPAWNPADDPVRLTWTGAIPWME